MIFQHKNLPSLSKNFEKIKLNILVVGGGRWAVITINELLNNFKNLKYIFIVTNNQNIIQSFPKKFKEKIIIQRRIKKKYFHKIEHAIVVNKNSDHYESAKNLLKNKFNILVEKPFVKGLRQFKAIKKLSQKKKN